MAHSFKQNESSPSACSVTISSEYNATRDPKKIRSDIEQIDEDILSLTSENDKSTSTKTKWSRKQWRTLCALLSATLTSSFAVCLFPPFFPRLAEEKGFSATVYGFVIGTNCLTSFIVTPGIGKNLPKYGVKFSFVCGTFIGAVCVAMSGFLQFYPPGWEFVVTAVFIRIIHASGNAMVITSTFTYSAVEFQNSVGTIFAYTRAAMNLAQLIGPIFGGALCQVGGFYLPFVAMGGLQALMGFISIILLPEISSIRNKSIDESKPNKHAKKVTIRNVLKIPTIWFSFVTFIVATVCNGFLSINLEPKVLRQFHLSPTIVGLLFGIKDGANSIASPFWGYVCDRSRKTTVKPYVIFSACLVSLSFIIMGAHSILGLQFELGLPIVVFALCLNGIGIGGEQVAGVVDALHEAGNAGYPDDPAMHGLIAGLWSSLSGAGRFVSRVGSGILVDIIGFDPTAAIVTGLQTLVAFITFLYLVFCECTLKKQRSVHWKGVTIIQDSNDSEKEDECAHHVVFTDSVSPSESIMGKTVSIDVPAVRKTSTSSISESRKAVHGSLKPKLKSGSMHTKS